ncbi:phospholipase/carboxylesterase [Sphingobacterium mizutaii NBRC 14946 = DSM 11724]|uniref:Hydrolase n=2 Tax=Sphingobacterium mizutaii TaxID=1010 RepID=A0AAJ4XBI9_9SPHI|nr:dienelactone hydrolase family protein [Sphingobacterium mizutaii]GEM68832.1 phospholipase/carboxylesterase [Sphingobacterium mizutaii NBRC 14946 = DSM 11724]SDL01268.1 phospholipase/carboxylesterase [Sphingobacterium mizutaii]SNV50093.1 putative hydrolase [Sphingobacterium mizutaii]
MSKVYQSGNINDPKKALIMIHGRGGSAQDIMGLAEYLKVNDYLLLGPEAEQNTWYPHSFIAPIISNQPNLDIALELIGEAVQIANEKGIENENIYFLGFSQGSCLTLEYTSRNAKKYGGIVAFTGGLIGEKLHPDHYTGNFDGTKVFIGTSDPDFHVPVERVQESSKLMRGLGAQVEEKIYPNMGHTISQDEIKIVNDTIFN